MHPALTSPPTSGRPLPRIGEWQEWWTDKQTLPRQLRCLAFFGWLGVFLLSVVVSATPPPVRQSWQYSLARPSAALGAVTGRPLAREADTAGLLHPPSPLDSVRIAPVAVATPPTTRAEGKEGRRWCG